MIPQVNEKLEKSHYISLQRCLLWSFLGGDIKDYYDLEYCNILYLCYSICHNLVYILAFVHDKAIMPS